MPSPLFQRLPEYESFTKWQEVLRSSKSSLARIVQEQWWRSMGGPYAWLPPFDGQSNCKVLVELADTLYDHAVEFIASHRARNDRFSRVHFDIRWPLVQTGPPFSDNGKLQLCLGCGFGGCKLFRGVGSAAIPK